MQTTISFFTSYITLGIFSFLQMSILPGYISIKLLKLPKITFLRTLVYSILLSLLCNYLFAFYTSLLGVFNKQSIIIFLIIEFILLIYVLLKSPSLSAIEIPIPQINSVISLKLFWLAATIVALSFLYVFSAFITSIGDIFAMPDMIGSYNNWATDWAINGVINPALTMKYPLLHTANWAFTYKFMGINTLQFFTKPTIVLLPLSLAIFLIDQFWSEKSKEAGITLFIWVLFLFAYINQPLNDGTFDVGSGCVAFIAFITCLNYLKDRKNKSVLYLALILSATAAIIKQAGILTMLFGYIWTMFILFNEYKDSLISKKSLIKNIALASIITILIGLSWYIWINWQIYLGQSTSESEWLMKGIHNGRNYIERFFYSISLLIRGRRSGALFIILFVPQLFIILIPKYRYILLLTLPFFIFWAFFFGYETRTFALTFPFFAFSAAKVIIHFLPYLIKKFPRIKFFSQLHHMDWKIDLRKIIITPKFLYSSIAILLVILASYNFVFDNNKLEAKQIEKSKLISDPEINEALYSYFEGKKLEGFIASQYGITKYLPTFADHHFAMRLQTNIDYFKSIFRRKEIHYMLLRDFNRSNTSSYDEKTFKLMEELQDKKTVNLVLDIPANGYKLFEIIHE